MLVRNRSVFEIVTKTIVCNIFVVEECVVMWCVSSLLAFVRNYVIGSLKFLIVIAVPSLLEFDIIPIAHDVMYEHKRNWKRPRPWIILRSCHIIFATKKSWNILECAFQGVKIKMDDAGNILIKRVSKCNVYVKSTGQDDENAIGNEILKLPGCALEPDKPVKVRIFLLYSLIIIWRRYELYKEWCK